MSVAAARSLNRSAGAALAPMIFAWVDESETVRARQSNTSLVIVSAETDATAMPVTSSPTSSSLRLIDMFRNHRTLSIGTAPILGDPSKLEQLRTDVQLGAFGGVEIDLEPHLALLDVKIDGDPAFGEAWACRRR